MRRLAVVACAFGLLLALPVPAGAAKVIDVPATAVFRAGNNGQENCSAFVFIQWPEQPNASAWRLDYEYLKGTANIRTHDEVNLRPPFSDKPTGAGGWVPPAGHHWYFHTFRSKSDAGGEPVECASLEAEMLGKIITATLHITVPEDTEEDESPDTPPDTPPDQDPNPPDDPSSPDKEKREKTSGPPKCGGKPATIVAQVGSPTKGTPRRDVIIGTPRRDVIWALGGNDLVCALGGDDLVFGGPGKDVLLGQPGKDTLRGQGASDTLVGGSGDDRLFGQGSADRLFGLTGSDSLNGGPGRPDLCNGGPGRDKRESPGCERRQRIP